MRGRVRGAPADRFEAARQQLGSGPAAMVGDRLDSDVAGGQQAGLAAFAGLG